MFSSTFTTLSPSTCGSCNMQKSFISKKTLTQHNYITPTPPAQLRPTTGTLKQRKRHILKDCDDLKTLTHSLRINRNIAAYDNNNVNNVNNNIIISNVNNIRTKNKNIQNKSNSLLFNTKLKFSSRVSLSSSSSSSSSLSCLSPLRPSLSSSSFLSSSFLNICMKKKNDSKNKEKNKKNDENKNKNKKKIKQKEIKNYDDSEGVLWLLNMITKQQNNNNNNNNNNNKCSYDDKGKNDINKNSENFGFIALQEVTPVIFVTLVEINNFKETVIRNKIITIELEKRMQIMQKFYSFFLFIFFSLSSSSFHHCRYRCCYRCCCCCSFSSSLCNFGLCNGHKKSNKKRIINQNKNKNKEKKEEKEDKEDKKREKKIKKEEMILTTTNNNNNNNNNNNQLMYAYDSDLLRALKKSEERIALLENNKFLCICSSLCASSDETLINMSCKNKNTEASLVCDLKSKKNDNEDNKEIKEKNCNDITSDAVFFKDFNNNISNNNIIDTNIKNNTNSNVDVKLDVCVPRYVPVTQRICTLDYEKVSSLQ